MNDRFLKACRREPVDCTPVWFMRQAGRYMSEYRTLRAKHSILEMCKTPELAAQVTLQPIERFPLDAAIIFADILLPLEPMGLNLEFAAGEGPVIHNPVRDRAAVDRLSVIDGDELDYVTDGEMWLFIGKTGFKVKAGDFVRIPGGEMHWAWVTGDKPCTMLHVHTPPFIGNPKAKDMAVGILTNEEIKNGFPIAKDIFDHNFPVEEVERAVLGK